MQPTIKCGGCEATTALLPEQQFASASTAAQQAWLAAVARYGLEYAWCLPCIARQDWGHSLRYGKGIARCNRFDVGGYIAGHTAMGHHHF